MVDKLFGEIMEGKLPAVYEDSLVFAVLPEHPANPGHIMIIPKKQYVILEQVPDLEIQQIFAIINKLSMSLFDSLHAQGTNIIIQNGHTAGQEHNHLIIHLIPRFANDGMSFNWQPKQLTEEQMSTIELKYKQFTKTIGIIHQDKPKEPEKKPEPITGEENYWVKQLRKIA